MTIKTTMPVSEAIVRTYGIPALRAIYLQHGEEQAKKIIKAAFKRDCPNYPLRWGAWELIMRSVKRKLGSKGI